MNAEEALALLGHIAGRFAQGEDLAQAAAALVDLALAAYPARAAFVARDLARARLQAELERDRGRILIEAALGAPAGAEPEEGEPGGDPRGFKYRYDEIVTRSPKMFDIFRKLDKVIPLEAPV